ncbi:hypothetical protein JTE90_006428 [Oedothorax gibbosus]|uniref:YqaJ viral recombinase domain-containing protein n=1 Tax=Oedothorax gibbosus TaxID=931172 RepID=A0AAV6TZ02_9ARAC|nr:hypothetical protein JTE90_006428 [Oedothorax gibbosus]
MSTDAAEFVKEKLVFSLKDIWELEQQTISQSESSLWKEQRKWRLTASNFYKVCVRRKDHTKLVSALLSSHSSDLSRIPAIAYGNKYESLVRTQIRSQYPNSLVRKVGLVTHPAMPHLAASPDGLIHNGSNTMLLEIKCTFNVDRLELEELAERSNFCLVKTEGQWELKRSHRRPPSKKNFTQIVSTAIISGDLFFIFCRVCNNK